MSAYAVELMPIRLAHAYLADLRQTPVAGLAH
jgi:hypothetical protein